MGLFAEIPMEVYIITAPTAVRDKYSLMEVGSFTEQTEAKVIYIPMGVDTIKSGMMLEYDREINIQYHAFPGR